jgi:hypothetical protein
MRGQFTRRKRVAAVSQLFGNIAGLLRAANLVSKGGENLLLNRLAALGVDRVSHVAVHFYAFAVGRHSRKLCPALIAESRMQMVFGAAPGATGHDFTRGHCYKEAVGAVDDFDVSDDKAPIQGNATESSQSILPLRRKLNGNIGDFH